MTLPTLERIDERIRHAQANGVLHVIETQQTYLAEQGIDFLIRWASSLAAKDRAMRRPEDAGVRAAAAQGAARSPFLPPESTLTLGPAGAEHWLVLNKFPVIQRHLLIVTRTFRDQRDALTSADFAALAGLLEQLGGVGFYNGGTAAGASQQHKHLQWIPESPQSACWQRLTGALDATLPALTTARHPHFAWRHAFVRLDSATLASGALLHSAFARGCAACALQPQAAPMPPYNLLLNREWMLVLPRSREDFEGVSINALGFAGSLFVRQPEEIERIRAVGPLAVLAHVACT